MPHEGHVQVIGILYTIVCRSYQYLHMSLTSAASLPVAVLAYAAHHVFIEGGGKMTQDWFLRRRCDAHAQAVAPCDAPELPAQTTHHSPEQPVAVQMVQ